MYIYISECLFSERSDYCRPSTNKSKSGGPSFIRPWHLNKGIREKYCDALFFVPAPIQIAILPASILSKNMPKVTIVIDFSPDEFVDLTSSDHQSVIDLVSLGEASMDDGSSSSSSSSSSFSSDDSSLLPSWTCPTDGHWRQTNGIFDECDGRHKESKSTANWYQGLISRRPHKR